MFLFPMAWLSQLGSQMLQAPSNLPKLIALLSSLLPCHSAKPSWLSLVNSSFGSERWLFAAGSYSETLRHSL